MNSQRVPLIFEVQTVHNEPNAPKSSKTSFMAVDDDKPLDFSTFKRYMVSYFYHYYQLRVKLGNCEQGFKYLYMFLYFDMFYFINGN